MDELLTIPRPAMRARGPELVPAVLVSLVVAVLFVVAALAVRMPDTVSFTVVNPTEWRADVYVRSATDSGWTAVGGVGRDSELEFLQVPDQGSEWVVRYSYAGATEDIEVTRDDLASSGWKLEVPPALADELERLGVAPMPGGSTEQYTEQEQ